MIEMPIHFNKNPLNTGRKLTGQLTDTSGGASISPIPGHLQYNLKIY